VSRTSHPIRVGKWITFGGVYALLGAIAFHSDAALAETTSAPRIHIVGRSRIDVQVARASGKVVIAGTVTDDTTRPVSDPRVVLSIARGAPGLVGAEVALSATLPDACAGAPLPVMESSNRVAIPADREGRFCARFLLPIDRYVAHLETPASPLLEGAVVILPIDLNVQSVVLRFDALPSILSLDDATTSIALVASTEDDGASAPVRSVFLQLSNESGAALASAFTDASGRARFIVDAARLGAPGPGEIRVTFAGAPGFGPAVKVAPVERHTRVQLLAPDARGGRLPIAFPEAGALVGVVARPACLVRGCAALPTGTIEAHVGETLVGASPLSQGAARLLATFAVAAPGDVPLRLSYVTDSPWFEPTSDAWVALPARPPRPWAKWGSMAAGLALAAWFGAIRTRRLGTPRARRRVVRASEEAPLRTRGQADASGWRGRVVDAHDGTAIADAAIRVERPGFEHAETLALATSGLDGAFAIESASPLPSDQLVVEAPLHIPWRAPLPGRGQYLEVALVQRRRDLLKRLVGWARSRGGAFDAKPEPTPGHVRRAAGEARDIAGWAEAVERVVYGGSVVDATVQSAIDRMAPDAPALAAANTRSRAHEPKG